jgi:hypothetical protein
MQDLDPCLSSLPVENKEYKERIVSEVGCTTTTATITSRNENSCVAQVPEPRYSRPNTSTKIISNKLPFLLPSEVKSAKPSFGPLCKTQIPAACCCFSIWLTSSLLGSIVPRAASDESSTALILTRINPTKRSYSVRGDSE